MKRLPRAYAAAYASSLVHSYFLLKAQNSICLFHYQQHNFNKNVFDSRMSLTKLLHVVHTYLLFKCTNAKGLKIP